MELRDDSIVLSDWRDDDARAVHAACQDREIQRWVTRIPRPYTHEHARALTAARGNLASQRVAEKVGFVREGVMRSKHAHPDGHRLDAVMFSLLPGELVEAPVSATTWCHVTAAAAETSAA